MSNTPDEATANAEENPDLMVGEPVQAEHDLDITAFVDDDAEPGVDAGSVK